MDELLQSISEEINRIALKLDIDVFCSQTEKTKLKQKLDMLIERRKTVLDVKEQYRKERLEDDE